MAEVSGGVLFQWGLWVGAGLRIFGVLVGGPVQQCDLIRILGHVRVGHDDNLRV